MSLTLVTVIARQLLPHALRAIRALVDPVHVVRIEIVGIAETPSAAIQTRSRLAT